MPRLSGRYIRTEVKTIDEVRRSLGAVDLALAEISEAGAGFWVKITDYTALTANRWVYSGYRQRYTERGKWENDPKYPDMLDSCIYNSIESNNTATPGYRGNSVNSAGADYPEGFYLQPIGGLKGEGVAYHNVVLWCWRVSNEASGEYAVQYENADDGVCSIDEGLLTWLGSEETFTGMNSLDNEAIFMLF